MTGFYHAIIIGAVSSLMVIFGIMLKNRSIILSAMLLSLTTASPIITFTAGASGAIVPSDLVSMILLMALPFGMLRGTFSVVVPKWRTPYMILILIFIASVLLISSRNMPDLGLFKSSVQGFLTILSLEAKMTIFRLFRVMLLSTFFITMAKMYQDEHSLNLVLKLLCILAVVVAISQIINVLGIANLRLSSHFLEYGRGKGYVLGFSKSAANRILFMGFFVGLILIRKSSFLKIVYLSFICLFIVSIILSGSRAGLVGLAAGLLVLTYRTRIKYIPIVVFSASALLVVVFLFISNYKPEALEPFAVFLPGGELTTHRSDIYLWTIEYLRDNPIRMIFGVGFFNYAYALKPLGALSEHAHNDVLTCIAEIGLLGFSVFVWWLVSLGKSVWRADRHAEGQDRWVSACINAAFWGLLATMFFEQTLFPSGGSLSLNRIEIMLFGAFVSYYLNREYNLYCYQHELYEPLEGNANYPGAE